MSYIPPHKRSSSSSAPPCPTPIPHSLQPRFKNHSHAHNKENKQLFAAGIKYAKNACSKWLLVGLADGFQLPKSTILAPFPVPVYDLRGCEKPLSLVLSYQHDTNARTGFSIVEEGEAIRKHPWDYIVNNVQPELVSAFERVKSKVLENVIQDIRPAIIARLGKVIFHGDHLNNDEANLNNLAQQRKTFFANLPLSHLDYMCNDGVSKLEFKFALEKELFILKLYDKMHPDSMVSCKCIVSKDRERLELHKVESIPERHFVADMSCLAKDLDLRLMLITKKIMTDLTENEIESIKLLISYAIIDPKVECGLRWPLGKNSSGDRFSVCTVAHLKIKRYRNSSISLKVEQLEPSVQNTGVVTLKMCGIVSLLQEL